MKPIELTSEALVEHLERKSGILIVDFWASWCGPCRAFEPVFAAAASKHPDITWAKVDTDAEPEISAALEIRAIPTLLAFKDGALVFRNAGILPPRSLEELVEKLRALDMAQARSA